MSEARPDNTGNKEAALQQRLRERHRLVKAFAQMRLREEIEPESIRVPGTPVSLRGYIVREEVVDVVRPSKADDIAVQEAPPEYVTVDGFLIRGPIVGGETPITPGDLLAADLDRRLGEAAARYLGASTGDDSRTG